MFNANNYVIDKLRRVTRIDLATDQVDLTITSIENPQVEFTGEYVDKTDANGVLLARFDTAKGATFSGEGSILSLPLMAAQLGTKVEVADSGKEIIGETFEVLTVKDKTATLTHAVLEEEKPEVVYTITADKNINGTIEIGVEEDTQASIEGTTLTLPTNFEGTLIGVHYKYKTEAAVKVSDGSANYADAAKWLIDIIAADVCNPSVKRAGTLVFPKAKLDNNFTLPLTTEGTHPFSLTALKDYCSDEEELCYLLFNE